MHFSSPNTWLGNLPDQMASILYAAGTRCYKGCLNLKRKDLVHARSPETLPEYGPPFHQKSQNTCCPIPRVAYS